jgi:hypothetical protein
VDTLIPFAVLFALSIALVYLSTSPSFQPNWFRFSRKRTMQWSILLLPFLLFGPAIVRMFGDVFEFGIVVNVVIYIIAAVFINRLIFQLIVRMHH